MTVFERQLLVNALKFQFRNFGVAGRCVSVVVLRERDQDTKGPGSTLDCDLKNGSDRLQKKNLRRNLVEKEVEILC